MNDTPHDWIPVPGITEDTITVRWHPDGYVEYAGINVDDERAMSVLAGTDRAAVRFADGISEAIEAGLIRGHDDLRHAIEGVVRFRAHRSTSDPLHGKLRPHEAEEVAQAQRTRILALAHPATALILSHSINEAALLAVVACATAPPEAQTRAAATLDGNPRAARLRLSVRRRYFRPRPTVESTNA